MSIGDGEADRRLPSVPEPDWADRIEPMPTEGTGEQGWRRWATETVPELARSARQAGPRSILNGRWLVDTTMAAAARIRPRDHETLTRHHRGRPDEEIARVLIRNAALATGSIGAATGALVTFQQAAPPTWSIIPFELAAETAMVVGVELKLVAELHQLADRPIAGGGPGERTMLLVGSWAEKRGVSATVLLGGGDLLSRQARNALARTLRTRLAGRMGRNMATLAPLMAGAAAGAEI
ncbi:MAG: hypothetical protein AAGK32_05340, partial [Actinomycetota bacterium]